jgi:SAM-dependent methyltransferase
MQTIFDAYAEAATPDFVAAYEALATEAIYAAVLDLFPAQPTRVLDVGAGTGRDAAWFAGRGHTVLAVEPVRALREAGQRLHPSPSIAWRDDHLPDLAGVDAATPFGLVLLGGVWQHLPAADQTAAMPRLAALTEVGGQAILSLRHGPAIGGRIVFPIDPDVTVATAASCGLQLVRRAETGSLQPTNRALGVTWTWLAFKKGS